MKIIFFGTPAFAVPSLDILVRNGIDVAAVVTAPVRLSGRGLRVQDPPVKIHAAAHNIPVIQPDKLNDPEFLNRIRELRADLFVVVAFRMMPEALWTMPRLGTFNLHASLLPQYRGAAPINRAIMNGETETGLTTFFLKHEIDTGHILFQEHISIGPDETAGELHDRLMDAGAILVLKTVRAIGSGDVTPVPQESLTNANTPPVPAPKIFTDDCRINWSRTAREVHNQIRGLCPFPGAFTHFSNGHEPFVHHKIFRSALTGKSSTAAPGTIFVLDFRLFIHCADEMLEILELQQEGRKRMPVSSYLRGIRDPGKLAGHAPAGN